MEIVLPLISIGYLHLGSPVIAGQNGLSEVKAKLLSISLFYWQEVYNLFIYLFIYWHPGCGVLS